VAQNKVTSDGDIASSLDCVDESLSEVESSNSENEIGNNQECDRNSDTSNSEQSDGHVAPIVSGWHNMKWQILLGVPQWHDVYKKY
jgi:hypothetical protein